MTTPDQMADDLNQLLSEPGVPKPADQGVVLAPRLYLDRKILEEGQTPRLMDAVKDAAGSVLLRKYEKLSKQIWQKYRAKPEFRTLHFVCESPLFVVQEINATYLIPEDFQFLGAFYHESGNDAVADQFFNEALKSGTADAYINAGVFRYNRGDRGVIDNFYVAKKHFNKALGNLHNMVNLTIDEKHQRRKLCAEAIDEIEYRFAPLFDKFFRFIIRLLTLHFETTVYFVGPAAAKDSAVAKFKELSDGILKREMGFKRDAAGKFLNDLHDKIPVGQSHLESELQEIETEYGAFATPEAMEIAVTRIGEFYEQNVQLLERHVHPDPGRDQPAPDKDQTLEQICFEMATYDDIEKVAAKNKLTSIGELIDMAGRQNIDSPILAWMIRDKMDQAPLMQRLNANPSVSDEVKRIIRTRHSF